MINKLALAAEKPGYAFRYAFNVFRKYFLLKKVIKNGEVFLRYKGDLYPGYLFKKKASSYIRDKALEYCTGQGIDIGAGAWPLDGAYPIENIPEENAYNLDKFADSSLDFIFSSHCLGHLDRWPEALKLWIKKLKPGGILFLYLPHESMVMWRPGEIFGLQHVWSPTWQTLNPFFESCGMKVVDYDSNRDRYWSFYIAAKKTLPHREW